MKRDRFLRGSAAAAFATAISTSAGSVRAAAPEFEWIDEERRWAIVPGVSLASIDGNAIVQAQSGLRDVAARLPVTPSTVFEAASLSKPVFTYAVFDLVRAGKLDLDRPLDSYLPHPYPIVDPRGARITARHVLTHTSGLPNWRHSAHEPLTLHFAPGTGYLYSGEGFYFLQTVVEAIAGTSMAKFTRAALDRLGMRRSSYVWRSAYDRLSAKPYDSDGKAVPHDSQTLGDALLAMASTDRIPIDRWTTARSLAALTRLHPPKDPIPWNAMPNAAWSLFTTASEYALFVRALLAQPDHPMLRPQRQVARYVWRGLGVALQKRGAGLAFFHTGSNPGFKAVMFGDLHSRRGVVSFANGDGGFPFNMHAVENVLGAQPAVFYEEQP